APSALTYRSGPDSGALLKIPVLDRAATTTPATNTAVGTTNRAREAIVRAATSTSPQPERRARPGRADPPARDDATRAQAAMAAKSPTPTPSSAPAIRRTPPAAVSRSLRRVRLSTAPLLHRLF